MIGAHGAPYNQARQRREIETERKKEAEKNSESVGQSDGRAVRSQTVERSGKKEGNGE
jgi:hypothetical protein